MFRPIISLFLTCAIVSSTALAFAQTAPKATIAWDYDSTNEVTIDGFQVERQLKAPPQAVTLSFDYRIVKNAAYEPDEISTVLAQIGPYWYTIPGQNYIDSLAGGGDTGVKRFTGTVNIPPGTYPMTIGGYNSKKTELAEVTNIHIDNVRVAIGATNLVNISFPTTPDGLTYVDDPFGTSQPNYAKGQWMTGGFIAIDLGGVDANPIEGMSGGWRRNVTIPGTDGTWAERSRPLKTARAFEDLDVLVGNTYCYRLRAYKGTMFSDYASVLGNTTVNYVCKTITAPIVPLPVPSNTRINMSAAGQPLAVNYTWEYSATDQALIDGFVIDRAVGGTSATYAELRRVTADVRGFSDLTIDPASTYCYRVRAYKGTQYSDPGTGLCQAVAPLAPPLNFRILAEPQQLAQ